MPAPRPPSEDIRKRFNQLVGTRTGKPSRPSKAVSQAGISQRRKQYQQGAGRQAIQTLVAHGGGKVPAAVRTKQKSWFGSEGTQYVDPIAGANKAFNTIYDNLTRQLNQQSLEQNAVRTAYAADVLDKQVNPEEDWRNSRQLGPSIDEQFLGGNVNKYVMDPLARVGSALPAALYETAKAGYEARDKGAGYWEQTLEGLKGLQKGTTKALRGEDYKGFGDVYEIMKNKSENPLGTATRALEEKAPWAEQTLAVGTGAVGDWYLHPLGRMVGGAKAGVIEGKLATAESMRAHARTIAERWAADAENQIVTGAAKAPGGYRVFPSEAAMADHFEKRLNDMFDAAELEVNSGGSKGRYQVLNPKMTASNAGALGSQSLHDSLTLYLKDRVQRLVDGMTGRGPKLSGNALDHWAALNPDFTEFLDDLTSDLVGKGHLPSNVTRDGLANYLSTGDTNLVHKIEQEVIDRKYTPYIQQASDDIAREFRNSYYNTPGIRVGNKVIPVKGVGKAFSTIESKFFNDIGKNFRYESVFPGSLSLDTTRARAWGVRSTEDFEKEIYDLAKNYTKADGHTIQRAIENNTVNTLSPELQYAANWIKDQNRWMYNEEFTFGARGRNRNVTDPRNHLTPYDPNYAYVSNRGGTVENRTRWKTDRKRTIHANVRANNGEGAGRFKTVNAHEANLRPTENAFEALRQRRIKYNRDMIRARFLADMVDKYGVVTHLNPTGRGYAAEARGLSKIDFSKLPESVRVNLERTGEDAYLPKAMKEMVDQFDDITKWHTGQQGRIARSFASVMRILKKGMTLPWPGFHNKNMIGDVFMGLLDHILPKDYANVIQKGIAALAGKEGMFKILKENPGLDLSFREMWHKYQSEANSGFINAELSDLHAPTKYNLPKRVVGRTERIATDISGFREDSGRFTHYVTAYQQEARELWKKGERDLAALDRKASSAALWRVNNYRFDYNALMLWEKQTKTLAFPFYTFIRKAAPTLMQAMYQDPRWISSWTRYLHQRSVPGSGNEMADEFDGFRVPQDIRDAGYAFIGGQEDEPWYVTNDILPTSVLNSVRTKNPHEFFNSLLSQVATPYQIGIEQGTGQQAFLDKPLQDQSFGDYLLGKVPGTREVQQFLNPSKPWGEKLLSSRIGAGLPIRKLRENQQLYAEQEWKDRLIDDPLQQINYSQDLFYISRQTSQSGEAQIYTVKNKSVLDPQGNATDIASFYTPEEAIGYVKKHLPDGYKKTPKTYDINNQGNPIYRPVNR